MIVDKMFQEIMNLLEELLPANWKKVIFYAEYGQGSFSFDYYIDDGSGKYIHCFDLDNFSKSFMVKTFINIDKVIKPYRRELDEKERWSNFTMIVDDSGKMETVLDYSDLSESAYEHKKQWKKKYII